MDFVIKFIQETKNSQCSELHMIENDHNHYFVIGYDEARKAVAEYSSNEYVKVDYKVSSIL